MNIRPARYSDLPQIRRLLAADGLPADDVDRCLATLLVGTRRGQVVAAGAIEPLGRLVLLRSLVVSAGCRGRGWGTRLAARLLDLAGRMGMEQAWLLTTSSPAFFAGLGFTAVPREAAPPAVKANPQFTTLCPASAQLMCRTIAMLPATRASGTTP